MAGAGAGLPLAPSCLEEFTTEWGRIVLTRWLHGQDRDTGGLAVSAVNATLNSQQVSYSVLKLKIVVN